MFLMPRDALQQLSQHIDGVIPQPAHKSQSATRSAERAMAASHGTTRWACKATSDAADLVRLPGSTSRPSISRRSTWSEPSRTSFAISA